MEGGQADDTFVVDSVSDTVNRKAAEVDLVSASVDYALTANTENLKLTGAFNCSGTGNALPNTVIGNSGHNSLEGGASSDPIECSDGNDTIDGGEITTKSQDRSLAGC